MGLWVLTRPPLGRGRDGDDEENEVDVSVNDLAHLTFPEWPLTIIWITTNT